MSVVGWSQFALDRHQPGSGFSYSSLSLDEVVVRVLENWVQRIPGTGETNVSRKVLVPVNPQGFFLSTVPLQEGMPIKAAVVRRQPHEDPYVETYLDFDDAERLGYKPQQAKFCNIVCYSREALLENGGTCSTDCEWEIVAILASVQKLEPMFPVVMARNFLEMPGGTKSVYTALEFAESIYYHSHKEIKIKKSTYGYENLTPEQVRQEIDRLKILDRASHSYHHAISDLREICKHSKLKPGKDSAVCEYCDADLGWRCEVSPDHVCHCECDVNDQVKLIDGTYVTPPHPEEDGEPTCLFCGEYDERK